MLFTSGRGSGGRGEGAIPPPLGGTAGVKHLRHNSFKIEFSGVICEIFKCKGKCKSLNTNKGEPRGVSIFVDLQQILSYSTIYNLPKRDKSTK